MSILGCTFAIRSSGGDAKRKRTAGASGTGLLGCAARVFTALFTRCIVGLKVSSIAAYSAGLLLHVSSSLPQEEGRLPIIVNTIEGNVHGVNVVAHGLAQLVGR